MLLKFKDLKEILLILILRMKCYKSYIVKSVHFRKSPNARVSSSLARHRKKARCFFTTIFVSYLIVLSFIDLLISSKRVKLVNLKTKINLLKGHLERPLSLVLSYILLYLMTNYK